MTFFVLFLFVIILLICAIKENSVNNENRNDALKDNKTTYYGYKGKRYYTNTNQKCFYDRQYDGIYIRDMNDKLIEKIPYSNWNTNNKNIFTISELKTSKSEQRFYELIDGKNIFYDKKDNVIYMFFGKSIYKILNPEQFINNINIQIMSRNLKSRTYISILDDNFYIGLNIENIDLSKYGSIGYNIGAYLKYGYISY